MRLAKGARGSEVEELQRALHAAGYAIGGVDGRFGTQTKDAVIAGEKVHRRKRDGVDSTDEYPLIIRNTR